MRENNTLAGEFECCIHLGCFWTSYKFSAFDLFIN